MEHKGFPCALRKARLTYARLWPFDDRGQEADRVTLRVERILAHLANRRRTFCTSPLDVTFKKSDTGKTPSHQVYPDHSPERLADRTFWFEEHFSLSASGQALKTEWPKSSSGGSVFCSGAESSVFGTFWSPLFYDCLRHSAARCGYALAIAAYTLAIRARYPSAAPNRQKSRSSSSSYLVSPCRTKFMVT